MNVWFGTSWNNAGSAPGIYRAQYSQRESKLDKATLAYKLDRAGWVTHHPKLPVLYSTGNVEGEASVVAFKYDSEKLSLVNSQLIGDGGSAFLTTDHTGQLLFSAQYGGGSVAVYPIEADQSIGKQTQLINHEGEGSNVNKQRQEKPHPHYVCVSPDNRYVYVPDLGLDQLVVYRIDLDGKKLVPHGKVEMAPGSGPRHMKFHPNKEIAFVLNELSLTIDALRYNAADGSMTKLQSIKTISDDAKAGEESNTASEIRIHPSGKFVYAGNRGNDTISVFAFNVAEAKLKAIQVIPVRGSWPRNFALTPDASAILAAGQMSNTVGVFKIGEDGKLTYKYQSSIFVPGPICVTFKK